MVMSSSSGNRRSRTIVSNTGPVPLEEILCTENLWKRPARPPNYETENRALSALVEALADSPSTILQSLAATVQTVFNAGSAGLSLLTKEGDRFYWAAIAGGWAPHLGGGTPRDFGPCGDVLDRDAPLLFSHWERRYPYLREATPLAEEALLVPFQVRGKAVGTLWVIAHDQRRRFDAEDLRQLQSLGRFAAAAHQAVSLRHDLDEHERNERRLQTLVSELNHRVKNTLATVQSIAKHTLNGSDLRRCDVFEARLIALARTHDLLANSSWQDASLRHLIQQELKPYRPNSVDSVVDGPDLAVPPRVALGLGMVFHELATNAAKYGALSAPDGHVRVTWEVVSSSEGRTLRIEWAEKDGPPVETIGRKGFGLRLIESGPALEMDGEVVVDPDPRGLICVMKLPLAAVVRAD